jgi:hypothetical protein
MDIPINPSSSPQYLIMFDNGTTPLVSASDTPALIIKPVTTMSDTTHLLPPFLDVGSKIMFEHKGQLHKGFLSKSLSVSISLAVKLTSIRRTKTGASTSPIYLQLGMIYVLKGYFSLAISHHLSCNRACHLLPQTLLVLETFNGNDHVHFSLLWIPHTLIAAFGWTVSKKKHQAYNLRTHMSKLVWPNNVPSEQRGPFVLFLQCVALR